MCLLNQRNEISGILAVYFINKTWQGTELRGTPQTSWTNDDLCVTRQSIMNDYEDMTETTLKLVHVYMSKGQFQTSAQNTVIYNVEGTRQI